MTVSVRPRILSGVQPSGKLHLGNYFGAIKQHIERQDTGECFYFIADYHALTSLKEAEEKEAGTAAKNKSITPRPARQILAENVRDVALDYLALGLDPAKASFFRQSDVPEVCELAWFFSSVFGTAHLERAHSYKDKVARGITPSVGLFTYPLLMAADILIYRSHLVPVGKDQEQHLEMTRDVAGAFNNAYGEIFPLPDGVYNEAAVVPGTDGQKMSKSYGNTIEIFAEGKPLKNAVMGVVTDSTPVEEPKNPDKCNAFALYKLFSTAAEQAEMADLYRNPMKGAEGRGGRPFGYGDAKTLLLAKIDSYFAAARERRKQLARDPGYVEEVLTAGARKARAAAQITLQLVRQSVGMGSRPV
ncbi:Tryptophan--tRNA ligase [Gemmata obscuriglobus]|uniref:Tryptophan--tRNA ligase n=1 Tax=Gemmata obscuriglobus TaxID=114 RepID=A0A2Z3HA37_9BACT|nr:tryptophan--tRNA ligase [Gemmata obscuriglobus]AWM37980.1 tryptophan--tRNA ligase [Gemmata obscuriglobus]QEG29159.1 Tryptophan--tRNA ligase [Gemmata obscuriglobus]VTS07893.1 tryptophanyl-trna synthetase : Tryptophan--tRNA ligase OS=Ilyobacter polytropus (strain DSM 2926 / CuHBu1) GN=trpS PE=3 SV=1: tRNA-synt_1b [Gemmata obscuriglobus UQM 2246]